MQNFKQYLNKSLDYLEQGINKRIIHEMTDGDWKQYYAELDNNYNLYIVTEILNNKRIITCINLFQGDELIEHNSIS